MSLAFPLGLAYRLCMLKRMLTTLCHVASQVTYQWCPGPTFDVAPGEDVPEPHTSFHLTDVEEGAWSLLIRSQRKSGSPEVPWLREYFAKFDPQGVRLLHHTVSHLRDVKASQAHYITIWDPDYPDVLRRLDDPPLCLTARGNVDLLTRPMVSVIGSRKGSGLAIQESFRLGSLLSAQGIVTVSGGALGCDIAAHHGVLAEGGVPALAVGVFAGGLQQLYPVANAGVFRRLEAKGGLFISERLWSAPARPFDFPVRNRLISGLSGVTFVMQAGRPSGAYITARMALDQGRDVAVLLHPPHDVRAEGSRALMEDGARGYRDVAEFVASIRPVNGI